MHFPNPHSSSLFLLGLTLGSLFLQAAPPATYLIAHRGASAYVPEHTVEAYRLAIQQGADYVEQDLSLSKDGVLICSHDPSLERVTNVEELFPDRFTNVTRNGKTTKHWYIEDFTVAEIKQLDAGSWFDPKYKGLKVLTFDEAVAIVKGKAGFFPELKNPGRLLEKGIDLEKAVADALKKHDLIDANGQVRMFKGRPVVHLQVFEEDSLRRLAKLLPGVPRSFLMGSEAQVNRWLTPENLKELKTFATGIAPSTMIVDRKPEIVAQAHEAGLSVVPYTFLLRPAKTQYPNLPIEMQKQIERMYAALPDKPADLSAAMRKYVTEYHVDGLFTDNPDLFPRQ
ncbi:glycerophosphodiester phosphodiesterase family protein [Bryobacter aggregatus]|uniref:glycerophosphodiester phosphodiesterase family protein n=1 Tax=Bryobacter aggregatus TaxID=360054 RepID=UPI0004E26331|nr:glycerophosphodiester phosphodiesterase family protein [Bryobacter aggregatus]